MRQKASDYSCIQLCANCHTQGPQAYHPIGRAAFAARWKLDVPDLERGVARGGGRARREERASHTRNRHCDANESKKS
jgi:hypothetical protein